MKNVKIGYDPQALAQASEWARVEGWEPGLADARAFAEVDPDGWFSARVDDGSEDKGQVVTTLSALSYDDTFGFIGLYITKPEFRGQGIGSQVWRMGREHLAACTSVGLDGVLDREATYASDGFVRSHVTTRYAGSAGALVATHGSNTPNLAAAGIDFVSVIPADAPKLANFELEHSLFPARREAFLRTWIATPNAPAIAAMTDDQVVGWGMIRPSVTGWRVGPLFALDEGVALALLVRLASFVNLNSTVYIDVPEPNTAAVRFVESAGFAPTFGCVRMYAGEFPNLALEKVYANTTFELG